MIAVAGASFIGANVQAKKISVERMERLDSRIADSEPLRPFTVADGVTMTRLYHYSDIASPEMSTMYKRSPDGRHVLVITRRGNLQTGNRDYQFTLFTSDDLLKFINLSDHERLKSSRPKGAILANVSTATNEEPIRQLRWLSDNRTLAFIGLLNDQEVSQVFSLDIRSKKVRQLTNHPTSVVSFDIARDSRDLIYAAKEPLYHKERGAVAFSAGGKMLHDIRTINDEKLAYYYQLYLVKAGRKKNLPRPLWEPFYHLEAPLLRMSPDGRWAIGAWSPQKDIERWLEDYPALSALPLIESDVSVSDPDYVHYYLTQFLRIDIKNGSVSPLLDAPTGAGISGVEMDAVWPANDRVIVSQTFLPLNSSEGEQQRTPAVVEFDLVSSDYNVVAYLPPQDLETPLFFDYDYVIETRLIDRETLFVKRARPDAATIEKYYRRAQTNNNVRWEEIDQPANSSASSQLELSIREDLNNPPELLAQDNISGRSAIVTDLNPQFRQLQFGKAEIYEWQDSLGNKWRGGLVYPPGFSERKRYPLVIQTHGFHANRFLIEGSEGTAYAAQALASKDILVLQLQEPPKGLGRPEEVEVMQAGIEAAIEKLDQDGFINREKVGLLGFSRTAYVLADIITFSGNKFAAAILSDSSEIDLFSYIYTAGSYITSFTESIRGGPPWGDGLENWIAQSPLMNSDKITTPILFELHDDGEMHFGFWGLYSLLRRQQKPAEFIVFPDAVHGLNKPRERLISKQGAVDWFAFWLQDEMDADPAKAEQYARWRKMRARY